ncbi:MAG: hypothetical protein K6G11_06455 [Lachnospiraceae bacterium]|nr:hypothetical protein [Lachnospiraceae bacterium]
MTGINIISNAVSLTGTSVEASNASVANASQSAVDVLGNGSGVDFTMAFIVISIIVSVAIPLAVIFWGKIKLKGSLLQILSGVACFIVFKLFLANIFCNIIMPNFSDQDNSSFDICLSIIIGVVFTAAGRWLFMFLSRKKRKDVGNPVLFAAGMTIMEAFIVLFFILIPYLAVASGGDGTTEYESLRVFVTSGNLVEGEEWRFLIKGYTVIIFAMLQIYTAVLTFTAVQKKMFWPISIAVMFELLVLLPNRMHELDMWYWGNNVVIIAYLGIISVIGCFVAYSTQSKKVSD